MMQITIHDLLKLSPNNIIDIRSKSKYLSDHILNAKSIDYFDLINRPELYINKDETYYIYCDSGIKSKTATSILNSLGYHTIHVIGGYNAYLYQS